MAPQQRLVRRAKTVVLRSFVSVAKVKLPTVKADVELQPVLLDIIGMQPISAYPALVAVQKLCPVP